MFLSVLHCCKRAEVGAQGSEKNPQARARVEIQIEKLNFLKKRMCDDVDGCESE